MARPASIRPLGPLALGAAALAGHAAAEARTTDVVQPGLTGPDPIASASAEAARDMGRLYLAQNELPKALQAWRQALAQDPDSVESLNGIAVCFDRLSRFEEARTHYEAALGIDPTSPVLLNNYGLSLYLQGAYEDAARFLSLAAAAGDANVQAAALRTLARIDQARGAPTPAAVEMADADMGAKIVRTSDHEQRLVLGKPAGRNQSKLASAGFAADLEIISAIGGLSVQDDLRIAALDRAAVLSEAEAAARHAARQEAARLMAEARAMVPADMQVAALLAQARASAAAAPKPEAAPASPWANPAEATLRANDPRDWYQDQILVMAPAPAGAARASVDRAGLAMALLAAGFAPPKDTQRKALAAAAQRALDEAAPRRQFEAPFHSDNDRLNGFAEQLHRAKPEEAPAELTVAEKVARLEELMQRMRAA